MTGGLLEIMTISPEHDSLKHLLRRLLEAWTEERGVAIAGYGSMTFKRRRFKRGLEPDECYWIVTEPQMRGATGLIYASIRRRIWFWRIDITRNSLDRMGIYSVMGVPEVWRVPQAKRRFLGPAT